MSELLELTVELATLRQEYEAMQALVEDANVQHNMAGGVARLLAHAVLDRDQHLADEIADEVHSGKSPSMATDIRTTPNGVVIDAKHWVGIVYGRAFQDLLRKEDGTLWNNLEQSFVAREGGRFTVTIQNCAGLTPAQQRAEALAERDALRLEVQQLRAGQPAAPAPATVDIVTCRCGAIGRRWQPDVERCPSCNREI